MRWTETVVVDRPVADLRPMVTDGEEIMSWSAWQEATGYTCSTTGAAGEVGSAIKFRSAGKLAGTQTLTAVGADRALHQLSVKNGPFTLRPTVLSRLTALDTDRSEVALDFDNPLPLPLRVLAKLGLRALGPPPARQGPAPAEGVRRVPPLTPLRVVLATEPAGVSGGGAAGPRRRCRRRWRSRCGASGPEQSAAEFARWFAAWERRGLLRVPDPHLAGQQFNWLVLSIPSTGRWRTPPTSRCSPRPSWTPTPTRASASSWPRTPPDRVRHLTADARG